MHNKHTPIHVFSSFMMEHVIPHDTRLASIITKRDFKKYSTYFKIMQFYESRYSENDDYIEKLEKELMQTTIPMYDTYCIALIERFIVDNKAILLDQWDKLHQNLVNRNFEIREIFLKYSHLILELEKNLNIQRDSLATREEIKQITSPIYNIDYKRMHEIRSQTAIALHYLSLELNKHPNLHSQENEQKELDYLVKVVNFELWNFISHMCHANTDFFKAPLAFISDIEKGTSHLRRAVMDIYDGLIVDIYHKKLTAEYLNLRNKKILSLGQSKSIYSLSESLKEYYLKISNSET